MALIKNSMCLARQCICTTGIQQGVINQFLGITSDAMYTYLRQKNKIIKLYIKNKIRN